MVSAPAENVMEANISAIIVLRIDKHFSAELVVPGLRPGIHVLTDRGNEDVDGRDACAKTRFSPAITK